jgi:4-coumarate--CoA ligase
MNEIEMEKSGSGKEGIFKSLRLPLNFLKDENANMVSFMFRDSLSYDHRLALADADSGEKVSFTEFKDKVSVVGSRFGQWGITKGDVVLCFSQFCLFPSLFLWDCFNWGGGNHCESIVYRHGSD